MNALSVSFPTAKRKAFIGGVFQNGIQSTIDLLRKARVRPHSER